MFEIQSINQKASQNEQSSVISYADVQDFSSASLSAKSSKCSCDSSDGSSSLESKAGGGVSSYPDLRIDTKSKEYSREQGCEKVKISESEELPPIEGKVSDLTGRGFADRWAVTATDLGVSTVAPNGKLISVFGDTFSGDRVGDGDWRSPVALYGTGDANHKIQYDSAVGPDPDYAKQLIPYEHDNRNISTIIPDDILTVGSKMYMHGMKNRGLGNVVETAIWSSSDNGFSWQEVAEFPARLHNGYAQMWSWDYNPDDGYVYVVSTGFQRDKGVILQRVRPGDIERPEKYSGWGFSDGSWGWDRTPTSITPPGEKWGELSLRRLGKDQWVLGGFLSSQYALGYRTISSPTADLYKTPLQVPVVGSGWGNEDHSKNRVAQLYGGFILPGSTLDKTGGVGLVVSQWNTSEGKPYKSMQFKVTLENTIGKVVEKSPTAFNPGSSALSASF